MPMRTALCQAWSDARTAGAATRLVAAALLVSVLPPAASAVLPKEPMPEPYVKRPASGAVVGYVIDAETRRPVEGALVSVQVNAAFPDTGSATARSDAAGRYQLRAPLGRTKSGMKMSPLIIFGEPIRKQEANLIDATQLNVSVRCAGYKPFLGAVPMRHAAVSQFRVYLAEILLAPVAGGLVSSAPTNFRWEHLEQFTVAPDIAEPGTKVTMTAHLRVRRDPDINYRLYAIAPQGLLEYDNPLGVTSNDGIERIAIPLGGLKGTSGDAEHREFAATARVRRRAPIDYGLVHILVFRGTDDVTPGDVESVLVQAPQSDAERAAAELCREAYALQADGELGSAVECAETAVKAAPEYRFGQEMLGDLYLAANRPNDAVQVLKKMVDLDPDDLALAYPRLAEALLAAGRAKEGIDLLLPLDKDTTKKKHRTESKMSPQFNIALARCYLALGDLEDGDSRLKRAGLLSPKLRRQLATERARAALAASPDSLDAHAGYARALADAARWEEAVAEFRTAAEADKASAWQYTDLAWALMEGLERHEEALPWAQRAVAAAPDSAEARLRLGHCYRHLGQYEKAAAEYATAAELWPHDFQARHWHGLALLARGETDAGAQELIAALELAREKGEHRPRFFGFFVPVLTTRVLVHGFRYPEADCDYILLDALSTLRASDGPADEPAQFLARFNVAASFVELGLPDAALPLLRECLEQRPDYAEALYMGARAHVDKGDPETAEEELQRVVAMNPLHPQAYLDLAQLRLEVGDAAAAERYIAQHRRNYPESAPRRPVARPATASGPDEESAVGADDGESVGRGT